MAGSGLAVVTLLLGLVGVLTRAWFCEPGERARTGFGLRAGRGGLAGARFGLGPIGRGMNGRSSAAVHDAGDPVLLAVDFVCAGYGPKVTRNFIPMALFTGACVLLWPNTEAGWREYVNVHAQAEAFDRDLAAGTPLFRLVRRYTPFLHPSQAPGTRRRRCSSEGELGSSNRSRRTRLFKSKPSNSLPPTFASPGGTTAASRSRESTRGSASICPRRIRLRHPHPRSPRLTPQTVLILGERGRDLTLMRRAQVGR